MAGRQECRNAEAESLQVQALAGRRRVLGEEHPNTLASMSNLGALYLSQGRLSVAEPLFTQAVEVGRRVLGPVHPSLKRYLTWLAKLWLAQHRYAGAESLLREALNGPDNERPESWEPLERQSLLGVSLMEQLRFAEAEPWLISGCRGLLQRRAAIPLPDRPAVERAGQGIIQLYDRWAKPEKSVEWHQQLQREGVSVAAAK